MRKNKLFVFLTNNKEKIPKLKKSKVRRVFCYDYLDKEFMSYLETKRNKFSDFEPSDLVKIVGTDFEFVKKFLQKNQKKFTMSDL